MADFIPKLEYGTITPVTITFDYPPKSDDGDQLNTIEKISTSISGVRQVIVENIEATRRIEYSHLTQTLVDSLKTFFLNVGGLGKAFKYYDDKDLSNFNYYELNKLDFKPRKLIYKGSGFLWDLTLEFRRIIEPTGDFSMSVPILNAQASPLSIAGLLFSSSTDTSQIIFYEIRRKTDSNEVVATGEISIFYRTLTSTWEISDSTNGDDDGVTFSITSGGQIQYTSNTLSGSNYTGTILFKKVALNV